MNGILKRGLGEPIAPASLSDYLDKWTAEEGGRTWIERVSCSLVFLSLYSTINIQSLGSKSMVAGILSQERQFDKHWHWHWHSIESIYCLLLRTIQRLYMYNVIMILKNWKRFRESSPFLIPVIYLGFKSRCLKEEPYIDELSFFTSVKAVSENHLDSC
jgi:hypothetical protein